MKYAELILDSWKSVDGFLAGCPKSDREYLFFIRNLYVANIELETKSKWIEMPLFFLHICYSVFNLFFRDPQLSERHRIVLLDINHSQDKMLSDLSGIPLAIVCWKIRQNFSLDIEWEILKKWSKYCILLIYKSNLRFMPMFKSLGFFLNGLIIYSKINLEGIEKVITQRDRYPEEIGLLKKAKENNIKTAKFDNYLSLGSVNHNTIYCDYYLYPNKINADHFRKYWQNTNVKFIEVGFPFWDDIAHYTWMPKKDVKIITFFSQYGYDLGIFGEKGPLFYIQEILNVIDDSFVLYIKKHPLEKDSSFQKLSSPQAKVLKPGEYENSELFSFSTFVLSLASQALIESKHINPQSAYLNYFPEDCLDWDYDLLGGKIDILRTRKDLEFFLYKKIDFVSCEEFISSFNPCFPKSMDKLSKTIADF
jgi:hypothetical protein